MMSGAQTFVDPLTAHFFSLLAVLSAGIVSFEMVPSSWRCVVWEMLDVAGERETLRGSVMGP